MEGRVGTCRVAVAAVLLLLVAQEAAAQGSGCSSECVPLQECPELSRLLRRPTREGIRQLQQATCFVRNSNPQVCCPTQVTTPSPTPTPDPTPVNNGSALLPKVCGQSSGFNRIIGGEVAPLDAYPWKAVLGYTRIRSTNVEFICGGSLISERYVMTAAHCIHPTDLRNRGLNLKVVRLGEWDLTTVEDCETTHGGDVFCAPPVQDYVPIEVVPHPAYNTRATVSDDIGLIRLDRPVDLQASAGHIGPVCLPPAGLAPRTVSRAAGAIVAGWGITEDDTPAPRIKHVTLPFVENTECSTIYSRTILDEQICMGGNAGEDSCGGDSGGPLVVSGPRGPPFLQVGIVSYGPIACGQKSVPGVYTSVSHYRKWIEQNMKP